MGDDRLAVAALELIAICRGELAADPDPARAARLHHEIADALEHVVGDLPAARAEYAAAIAADPQHVASLRGARRVELALGSPRTALPLFDAEMEATPRPHDRAWILYERGRLVEDRLRDLAGAREVYAEALALDPGNPTLVRAALRCARHAHDWPEVVRLLEHLANATRHDERLRAALVVERAHLVEARLGDPTTAAALYDAALAIDADADGALAALARLHSERGDWTALLAVLDRTAARSPDPADRAELLHRAARIQDAHLGNRRAAIALLERALECAPRHRVILDELVRHYREARNHKGVTLALAALIELTDDPADRVALWLARGQAFEADRGQDADAARCYREALALAPTHVPALQALGALLARGDDWAGLVDMHLGEANAAIDTDRRAAAHVRVAELLDTHLREPGDAAAHYATALALAPGHPAAFKALTRLYAAAGEHHKLIDLLERAIDQAAVVEHRIAHLFKIGSLWEDAVGDPVQAAHAYDRVLELRGDDVGALHALQRVHERAGRHQDLVDALLREAELSASLDVTIGLVHRAASVLDDHLQDPAGARRLLLRALDLDAGYTPALASLGRLYHRAGQWQDLLGVYQRELDLTDRDDERAELLTKIGELRERRLGAVDAAIDSYRDAVDAAPGYRPAVRALVARLEERHAWDDVVRILERHLDAQVSPAARLPLLYRIAELEAERLDRTASAIDRCEQALAGGVEHRPFTALLERLLSREAAWPELAALLGREAERAAGTPASAALELRRARILGDRLDDDAAARAPFEAARAADDALPALLALEPMYAAAGEWTATAAASAAVATDVADPGVRVAALRDALRCHQLAGDDPAPQRRTAEAILAIEPDAPDALALLAQLATGAGDLDLAARSLSRLGRSMSDPRLAAHHWLRLAEAFERAGDRRALDAYRAVVDKAPRSLAAARGMARAAAAIDDPAALADAYRHDAGLRRGGEAAAALLVDAAALRNDRIGDAAGAIADLEQALARCPDSGEAADRLAALLRGRGDDRRVIDVLSRAAGAAARPDRRAALWRIVAASWQRLDDPGAAIAAIKRGIAAAPEDASSIRALAQLYVDGRQWLEAIATFEQLAAAPAAPHELRAAAYVDQARIWHASVHRTATAVACADAALALVPGHRGARALLAQLHASVASFAEADELAHGLLADAPDAGERCAALRTIASIQHLRGDPEAAKRTLVEAFGIEGPGGDVHAALAALVAETGDWHTLAAALVEHLRRGVDPARASDAYLALAVVYGDRMRLPGKAIETLDAGLAATGDRRLALDLVDRRHQAGDDDGALRQLRALIAESPHQPALWRVLARIHHAHRHDADERRARLAIEVLGDLRPDEQRVPPSTGLTRAAARTFGAAELHALAVDRVTATPAADLVAATAEGLPRLFDGEHRQLALSRRDRLAAGHPARAIADPLMEVLGVEAELYEQPAAPAPIRVILAEPITLVVSDRLQQLPAAARAFLIARPLALGAAELHPVMALSVAGLRELLAGAASLAAAGSPLGEQIRKLVPRRLRRSFEAAVDAYAPAPVADVGAWRRAILLSASRAAAVLIDDVGAAVAALSTADDGAPADAGAVAELLRSWGSETALRVRQAIGI
jgi:cellulose synthase operon protein C